MKRLEKSSNDRVIDGVCGGIAKYTDIDVTVVRLAVVILSLVLVGLPMILVYVIFAMVLPREGEGIEGERGGKGKEVPKADTEIDLDKR